jgi:uncharacterized protein YlxP (DUF503 family)
VVVGILQLDMRIPDCHSLKEKRAAIRPLVAALAREFSVSVAEVGAQDSWQHALLGVCAASSDRRQADRVLQAVLRRAEGWSGEAILHETSLELVSVAALDPRL